MAVTNEFERDLINQAHLKRPGRIDMIVFQNLADVGDGSPGIQRCFRNYLHEGGMEKDLDLVGYGIKGTSVNINNAELQQLSNIGASVITASIWTEISHIEDVTITNDQWGYVGAFNQSLTQTSNVNFGQITMSGNIIMGSDDITFTAGGLVDTVDVSAHDHSGSDKGVAVPFTSLSGDIIYSQLDSIVDTSGVGTASKISVATHQHTDADGSSKITHANTTGRTIDDHHARDHDNDEHTTDYEVAFSKNNAFNKNFDESGVGTAGLVSEAVHVHTGADGSSKVDHVNLLNIGSNSHVTIDDHLSSLSKHFLMEHGTYTGNSSASQIISMNQNMHLIIVAKTSASQKSWIKIEDLSDSTYDAIEIGVGDIESDRIEADPSGFVAHGECNADGQTYTWWGLYD